MDAGTLNIDEIFYKQRRYLVPLYQRPYVWKQDEQWEPLWEDIRSIADNLLSDGSRDIKSHFLGAIVLEQKETSSREFDTRFIIDGQQRLTTIQILLEAFHDYCLQVGALQHHEKLKQLTRNNRPLVQNSSTHNLYKLWPTNVDQEHFENIMEALSPVQLLEKYGKNPTDKHTHNHIADAYLFFYEAIADWVDVSGASELDDEKLDRLTILFETLTSQLKLVVIDLKREDDAQLIFETLNARGTPLLPSDLVKNFLFNKAKDQDGDVDILYSNYWRPLDDDIAYWREEIGRGHAKRHRIDIYLMNYLTIKCKEMVSVTHLYEAFKSFASKHPQQDASYHLKELYDYSEIYKKFDALATKSDRLGVFYRRLEALETTTAYPFILECLRRYGFESKQVLQAFIYLESFLVRRMVCLLNTRAYSKFFTDMLKVLDSDESSLAVRVAAYLTESDSESNRWPNDNEFKEALVYQPIYKKVQQNRVRMLLEAINTDLNKKYNENVDQVIKENLTIEHLMPQEWEKNWPSIDSSEEAINNRNILLHSIGNLTLLTGKLNSNISNGAWSSKKEKIWEHSRLNLNQELRKVESWSESEILNRSHSIFETASSIWPCK